MSNNKQSSIIWFAVESWKLGMQLQNKEISIDKYSVLWVDLLVKAKAMHKEEIEDAHWYGGQDVAIHESTCEQYYNETFNTKEK